MRTEKLLLHLCCAPCAPYPLRLLKEKYDLTLYFYNPNIHPKSEYLFRLKEVEELAKIEGLTLIVGEYKPEEWFEMTKGLESSPERGERCELCISDRMSESGRKASELNIKNFGAVISVSPHKDAMMINRVGVDAGREHGVKFYTADFKKKEGFKISSKISKELGFKRQNYCGCSYSVRE